MESHLHGGVRGFDRHVWDAAVVRREDGAGVMFARISPAGEEHFPGTLTTQVTYLVMPGGLVRFVYQASTNAPTIVNLTQHTYFNLAGEASRRVRDYILTIDADRYTPVDATLIATGTLLSVGDTPLDFRVPHAIGERAAQAHPQLRIAGGFDHNFVLTRDGPELMHAARLRDPLSGRVLISTPPNQACSSTTAICSTDERARTGDHWSDRQDCVWKHSTSRIPRTTSNSRTSSSGLVRGMSRSPNGAFRLTDVTLLSRQRAGRPLAAHAIGPHDHRSDSAS